MKKFHDMFLFIYNSKNLVLPHRSLPFLPTLSFWFSLLGSEKIGRESERKSEEEWKKEGKKEVKNEKKKKKEEKSWVRKKYWKDRKNKKGCNFESNWNIIVSLSLNPSYIHFLSSLTLCMSKISVSFTLHPFSPFSLIQFTSNILQ